MGQYVYDGDTVKEWAGDSQWRALQADLARFKASGYSGFGSEGFWALAVYRLQRGMEESPNRSALLPARLAAGLLKKLVTMVTHINLPKSVAIGPGLLLPHVGPIQLTPGSSVGADCAIHHTCTLAAANGSPTLGDHVMLGCHVVVLGGITVHDNAAIGAGVTVTDDVPEGGIVVGAKSRLLETRTAWSDSAKS